MRYGVFRGRKKFIETFNGEIVLKSYWDLLLLLLRCQSSYLEENPDDDYYYYY